MTTIKSILFVSILTGLIITSCENERVKIKHLFRTTEELELVEKTKKTNEYNSLQLSKLKDKWSKNDKWNKNEQWLELLGMSHTTYDLQKDFMNKKIGLDTVRLRDFFMSQEPMNDYSTINDKWNKYRIDNNTNYIAKFRSKRGEIFDRYLLFYELTVEDEIFIEISQMDLGLDSKLYIVFQYDNIKIPNPEYYSEDRHNHPYFLKDKKYPLTLCGNLLDYFIPNSDIEENDD